ncbi:histidine kinase [Asanoa sp. WMMD1127]|uniref:sensor histidine kinase n=1 Tax=Asanoa sp. WMMD1127 TaxID=3016107 RepID=UPI0024162CBA|nr:histidine kinase [Asanoa sp. WMMD1127]MDG4821470.1 histidine kinase [Asanoa sp. WMMD1127]
MTRLLAPLVRASTYRRGVHLLLGGVLLLPYVLLGVVFATMLTDDTLPQVAVWVLLLIGAVIAVTPAFLGGTRAVEIVAARVLLGVDLPEPAPGGGDRETTLRGALWFGAHLAFGGVVGVALFTALPMALAYVTQPFGGRIDGLPLAGSSPAAMTAVGVVLLVVLVYAVAGLGSLAAVVAPVLLGPSPAARIASLEARADRLVERARLARELHDSVGHALTVTTLQAAAAQRASHDPEFVRQALVAIEETGRAAMEDLDHVLGLLRAAEHADRRPAPPQRTLADVDRIVADVTGAGLRVSLTRDGPLATVPAAVSREGYRIVQEALTNAVRHAGPVPVTVHIAVADRSLRIDVANPVTRSGAPDPSGRGLAGMRERVDVLGGRMTVGTADGRFTVAVRLPIGGS